MFNLFQLDTSGHPLSAHSALDQQGRCQRCFCKQEDNHNINLVAWMSGTAGIEQTKKADYHYCTNPSSFHCHEHWHEPSCSSHGPGGVHVWSLRHLHLEFGPQRMAWDTGSNMIRSSPTLHTGKNNLRHRSRGNLKLCFQQFYIFSRNPVFVSGIISCQWRALK